MIEEVGLEEWAAVEMRPRKHEEVFEVIETLRKHPEKLLKIRGDVAKQHVVLEYGKRKGIKMRTFADGGFIYIRRRDVKPAIARPRAVFPTTAEEWRQIAAKRSESSSQRIKEINRKKPKKKPVSQVDRMLELAAGKRPQYSL